MNIEKLIKQMSVEEKFCQMTQVNRVCVFHENKEGVWDFTALNMTDEQYDAIGSILSYTDKYDVKATIEKHLQKDKNKIPLIIMLDIIHGYKTAFPIPLAMGASFNVELVEKCCEFTALEAIKDGVMATFSPMVDLVRDARWGRVMESTGEDPYLNGEFGKAFIRGYHKGGLLCCVKHFAGYGGAEGGRDYNLVDMSEHTLREYYLRAYKECMKEKPDMVMTAFNSLNGIPSTANKHLLVDILRNEWGFDGVVITDYDAVSEMVKHRHKENLYESAKSALEAGVDIEMCSSNFVRYGKQLVENGEIDLERVKESVDRILKLKEKLGLFDNPYYKLQEGNVFVSEEGRNLAKKMAEESIVLLKNDGVLPLSKDEKVVLIGPFANSKEIVGNWCAFCDNEATVSVKCAVEKTLGGKVDCAIGCGSSWNETDDSEINSAIEIAKSADKIILCVGESQTESGECKSKTDICIPYMQRKLINEIYRLKKPVVGVIFAGRPLVIKEEAELLNGILYAWHTGTEGGNAVANILYGKVNPSAKLSMSLPTSVGQCPVYYSQFSTGRPQVVDAGFFAGKSCYLDDKNYPLYPFGYGLSYTNFEILSLEISNQEMKKDQVLTLMAKVKNTGSVDGATVVQFYLRDDYSSYVRPIKELKGFKKVFLKPNEEVVVEFKIDKETLSYYGEDDELIVEKGGFTAYVGLDSIELKEVCFKLI